MTQTKSDIILEFVDGFTDEVFQTFGMTRDAWDTFCRNFMASTYQRTIPLDKIRADPENYQDMNIVELFALQNDGDALEVDQVAALDYVMSEIHESPFYRESWNRILRSGTIKNRESRFYTWAVMGDLIEQTACREGRIVFRNAIQN